MVQHDFLLEWCNTVECHYGTVQYDMILHMVRQWLRQSMNQRLYSWKTPHISPSQASYGVSFVKIWVKINRVITALQCISEMRVRSVPLSLTMTGTSHDHRLFVNDVNQLICQSRISMCISHMLVDRAWSKWHKKHSNITGNTTICRDEVAHIYNRKYPNK